MKNATLEADLGTHAFIPQGQYGLQVEKNVWEMDVVIDGVERTIRTNKAIAEYLSENTGKLFHIEFADRYDNTVDTKYGEVVDATLVNEEWDSDGNQNVEHDGYDCDYITYYDLSKAEVQQIAKGIKAGTIYSPNSEHNWQITDKTVFINQKGNEIKSLDNVVLEDHDIWVIGSTEKGSYEHALVVYVGEKLDKSVALDVTVSPKEGTITVDKDDPTQIKFTSVVDGVKATLTYTANDDNSVILYDGDKTALKSVDVEATKGQDPKEVTVYNEAGTEHKDYLITLEWPVHANVITITIGDVTMDTQKGCEVNFTLADKDNAVTFTAAMVKVKLVNEKGQDVYTNADIAETETGFKATMPCTLTANASYKVVITVDAGNGLTATEHSEYIEAQTAITPAP